MFWRSNALRARMDFEVLYRESYGDPNDKDDLKEAYGNVRDRLRNGEFAFQVGADVYSTGDGDEPVDWDTMSDRARAYAVHAAVRLGLEGLGFERDSRGSFSCDRDFFEVCYGGRFDGERIPGVYAYGDWRERREEVIGRLRREYGVDVEVKLGLEVRARALEDGTVFVSADPRARVISEKPLKDLVGSRGKEWAVRVLPGTYVVPTAGRLAGLRLKVVDATPVDEWEGTDGIEDVDDLRNHWERYGLRVDPEVVVTVEVGRASLVYPDDVLRWQVPAYPVTDAFKLGVADRISIGRFLLERALDGFESRFPDVVVDAFDHPRATETGRVRPPSVVVDGGSGKRTGLMKLLGKYAPYEGAGELDGETVDAVVDRRLPGRAGVTERHFERLLELVVRKLRELFNHGVKAGDVIQGRPEELPDLVEDIDGPVLVGVPSDDDRTYARVKLVDPLTQCFTERVFENDVGYAATGLAIGVHCKRAGQPYAVRTTSGLRDVAVVGVDVSRKVENGRVVEGRACCSCFVVKDDGVIGHGRTFTVPVGERGEESGKTAEIALEAARRYAGTDRVIYLRDGSVPGEELEAVRGTADELGLDVTVVEVIKSDPTVYGVRGSKGWDAPKSSYVRLDGSAVHLCCSPYRPPKNALKNGGKPGTARPILLRRPDGSLGRDLIGLVHDLTASNWGNPSGVWSRLPAPVLYADRAARLARYGVSVGPNTPESERPWPV